MIKILGFEREQGACGHYRIVQPLYKMLQQEKANILTIHPGNGEDLEFVAQKIIESDIIVFQRPADDRWLNFLKVAQKNGKIIVVDYDDNPFETSPLNPSYQYYGVKEYRYRWPDGKEDMLWENGKAGFDIEANITRRDYFRAAFKRADLVTTTTPILQKELQKINKNTAVLPNVIDFDLFEKADMVKKEIRIGWQGGFSHYEDLYMIVPAIKKIVAKYPNVKFVFFGDMRFKNLFKDIPEDRIEAHHWVQRVAYNYKLALLNLDIGLCPVIDNTFNRCKSSIKYLEYSALGIPSIASNIPPYSPDIVDGETGLLVSEKGWFNAMELLIEDKKLRLKMGESAYQNAYKNHNADKEAHKWVKAYEDLLKKDVACMS